MHGVLRLIVTLDGKDVIDCEPILGLGLNALISLGMATFGTKVPQVPYFDSYM